MRVRLRQLHAATSWLFVGAILVQVFLAGSAILNLGGSGDFGPHIEFGYTAVGIIALAVLLTAVAARAARRDVAIALGLLVLYIIQTTLPAFRASIPAVAALHPVNAMLLFGLSAWYARHAWRAVGAAAAGEPARSAGEPARSAEEASHA
jgi:hypothetical protein